MAREMKDSGIAWIGEIPREWSITQLKRLGSIQTGSTPSKTEDNTYYSDSSGVPWIKAENLGTQYPIHHTAEYLTEDGCAVGRVFEPYTIFVCCIASVGKVGYSNVVCSCNQQINGITFNNLYYWKYGYYVSVAQETEYIISASGNVMKIINSDKQSNLCCPVPPFEEQRRIADFLDAECSRIDAVIEKTRASIEEYTKLKQSVITQAVTKGIRPGRKMKDSGIEWIGEIPEEWDTVKLKYFSKIRSGITLGKVYPAETELFEYPYLRVANVQGSYTSLEDIATIMVTKDEAKKYCLEDGELLMTEGGDRDKLGRGAVWHAEISPCLHQNHVFALRTDSEKLLAEYVSYLSESLVGRDYFDVTANQSVHLASTNSTTIMNFIIPFPSLREQEEIIHFIRDHTSKVDVALSKKNKLVSELESYKKSLVFEYVTGKKEAPIS